MLGQKFFYYSKNGRRGKPPICIPMIAHTKQETSALWTFQNFLGDLSMCLAQEEQRLFAHGLKHLFLAEAEVLWHSAAAWETNKLHLKA